MSQHRKYFNKVPPFTPDPEHYTRKQHSWKAKVAYDTEEDAWEYLNQQPHLLNEGMTVYQCHLCCKWHIGHQTDKQKKHKKNKKSKNKQTARIALPDMTDLKQKTRTHHATTSPNLLD